MLLPRSEVKLSPGARRPIRLDILPVDEIIGSCRWSKSFRKPIFLADGQVIEFGNVNMSKINVIVSRSRAVDNHRTINTITILSREVRMVPSRSVLSGLESICFAVTRGERTFSQTINAILGIGIELAEAMPICK